MNILSNLLKIFKFFRGEGDSPAMSKPSFFEYAYFKGFKRERIPSPYIDCQNNTTILFVLHFNG